MSRGVLSFSGAALGSRAGPCAVAADHVGCGCSAAWPCNIENLAVVRDVAFYRSCFSGLTRSSYSPSLEVPQILNDFQTAT